ncbi:MAG: hypothetical protein KTR31_41940 [Myxococcales bacterium]|nr:hypothetical protein [Myxococcales bacterium]
MPDHESYAVLQVAPGHPTQVRAGDLIGRLRSAALRIDDPRVSEAHAYVSLRDGCLKLLALRGGMAVDGTLVREVSLRAELRVALAHEVFLEVQEVRHAPTQLELVGPGVRVRLTGRALSLVADRGLKAVGRITPGALAQLWTDGEGWVCRVGEAAPQQLQPGSVVDLCALGRFEVVAVPAQQAQVPQTASGGRLDQPLRIEGYYDTVHLHRPGLPPLVLSGTSARLIHELGAIGQPVGWRHVAGTLWPDDTDHARMRKRWDVLLVRLRKRLVGASIRPSLVQADGSGQVRLLLESQDAFEDRG